MTANQPGQRLTEPLAATAAERSGTSGPTRPGEGARSTERTERAISAIPAKRAAQAAEPRTATTSAAATEPQGKPNTEASGEPAEAAAAETTGEPAARAENATGQETAAAAVTATAESEGSATGVIVAADVAPGSGVRFGSPAKGVLAGAGILGALLIAVPLLLSDNDRADSTAHRAASAPAGTDLGGAVDAAVPPVATASPTRKPKPPRDQLTAPARKDAAQAPSTPSRSSVDPAKPYKKKPAATVKGAASASGALKSAAANLCMGLIGDHANAGVRLLDCVGGPSQTWKLTSGGELVAQDLCVTPANSLTAPGTAVVGEKCVGAANQRFDEKGSMLVNRATGLCLDVRYAETRPGAVVQLWTCSGAANQTWSGV
ncbi:ricin-type beta-trefoil lectin domain protein [Streptomyces sp. NPDC093675]|uniref:ricin-type beta-trefoil lectin domain protein n=1 Tax=Streptomyces sp. NPDC093675 TaxID=3366049 RepID=UPI003824BE42